MLYVNYLTLALIAVSAVLFLAARYVLVGEGRAEERDAYALAACAGGAVMAVTGIHLTLTWPLPGQYNIAFGEPLAYFGALLIAGGLALRHRASTQMLAMLGAFGGAATLLVAAAIMRHRLTAIPGTATAAFGLVGLAALSFPFRGLHRTVRGVTSALLGLAGAIFGLVAASAILHHLAPGSFNGWIPR